MPAPPPLSDYAIDLHDVAKTYRSGLLSAVGIGARRVHALRGVSMQVRRGEVFGLLGPNGAGKSTLVKILMTVIRPTRCRGTMLGRPVGAKSSLARVGYLPESHRFPDYLKAWQVLDFYGALAEVPRATRRARAAELLDLVGLSTWKNEGVKGFSKGMKQRLGIANALMNDPDLVVLDEPTDGVDPVGRKDIREILLGLRERGKTVFLNSHLLSELEMVCERVAIMVQGNVVSQGTISDLTADSRRYEIDTDHADAPRLTAALDGLITPAGTLAGGARVRIDDGSIRLSTSDAADVQPVIDRLRAANITLRALRPVRSSLEDLFMQAVTDPATGRTLAPGAAPDPEGARP